MPNYKKCTATIRVADDDGCERLIKEITTFVDMTILADKQKSYRPSTKEYFSEMGNRVHRIDEDTFSESTNHGAVELRRI